MKKANVRLENSNCLTDEYNFYFFNGESYFYGWNYWSDVGNLLFLYDDIMEKIAKNPKLKKNTLYSMSLSIDRNHEDPEDVFDWDFSSEVVERNQIEEVKRIANEIRDFDERDKDIWADLMDKLVLELKKAGLK